MAETCAFTHETRHNASNCRMDREALEFAPVLGLFRPLRLPPSRGPVMSGGARAPIAACPECLVTRTRIRSVRHCPPPATSSGESCRLFLWDVLILRSDAFAPGSVLACHRLPWVSCQLSCQCRSAARFGHWACASPSAWPLLPSGMKRSHRGNQGQGPSGVPDVYPQPPVVISITAR
jgi:hypothetical protein